MEVRKFVWLDCPRCGAKEGEFCRSPSGKKTLHKSFRKFRIESSKVNRTTIGPPKTILDILGKKYE